MDTRLRAVLAQYDNDGAPSDDHRPPRDIQDFADLVETRVAAMFGSTTHLKAIQVVDDNEMPANVGAAYMQEDGGTMIWRRSSLQKLSSFLDGSYRRMAPGSQVRFLSDMKLELNVFFHEMVHSQGVASTHEFEQNMAMDNDQRVLAFSEGLTAAISDTFLGEFITAMGLDKLDPRLQQVRKPAEIETYPGLTETAFVVLVAAAAKSGTPEDRQALTNILNRAARTGERFEVAANNLGMDLATIPAMRRELVGAAQTGNGGTTMLRVAMELISGSGREHDPEAVRQMATVIGTEMLRTRQINEAPAPRDPWGRPIPQRPVSFEERNARGVQSGLRILGAASDIAKGVDRQTQAPRRASPPQRQPGWGYRTARPGYASRAVSAPAMAGLAA